MTQREVDVLLVVAEMGSQQRAATELGLSVQTVKNHLYSLGLTLGTTSTLQAYHRLLGRPNVRVVTTTTTTIEEAP